MSPPCHSRCLLCGLACQLCLSSIRHRHWMRCKCVKAGAHTQTHMHVHMQADEYAKKGITLTPELWLVKLMVGAIDPRWTTPP